MIREVVPYEEYLSDLLFEDRAQAKAHLVAMLSAMVEDHTESVVIFRAGLPPEQIREAYLADLFPDEASAAAYLWALRPENDDPRIRKIEGEKEDVTDQMVDPLSHTRRQHAELLEMVWAVQKANDELLDDPTQAILVKLFINYGDSEYQALFDVWAEAEISRVRMRRLVRDLQMGRVRTRPKIFHGTYLKGSRVSLRHWIIAAALVSQAKESLTPADLQAVLGVNNRDTPRGMLNTIRKMMVSALRYRLGNGTFRPGNIGFVDNLAPDCRLYFQSLGDWHNTNHRNDLMLQGIGNMMIDHSDDGDFVPPVEGDGYIVRPAYQIEHDAIHKAFNEWIEPYHNSPAEMRTVDTLSEFAFRYQYDKRRLMGWRLINSFLRALLMPEVD